MAKIEMAAQFNYTTKVSDEELKKFNGNIPTKKWQE